MNEHIQSFVSFLTEDNDSSWGRFIIFFSPYAQVSSLENNCHSSLWLERYAIAQNPNTPDNALNHLVKDGNKLVRSAAYINKLVRNLVENPKTLNLWEQLATGSDNCLRLMLAKNQNTPISILKKLATDEDKNVRIAVFNNQNTSESILKKLAIDEDENVRIAVFNNQNTPVSVLEKLATDENVRNSQQSKEASLETTSPQRLKELANQDLKLARIVAKNISAPSDLLAELAHSQDESTRKAVASNPNTPKEILLELGSQFPEELLDNPIFYLLLVENPNLLADMPTSTLKSMVKQDTLMIHSEWRDLFASTNSEKNVRRAVAENRNIPVSILEKLATDSDRDIRRAVGENRNTPATALKKLATSHRYVRSAVAKNPNTPVSILEKLATDSDIDVCCAVAQNQNTPVALLEKIKMYDIDDDIDDDIEIEIFNDLAKSTKPNLGRLAVFLSPYAEVVHLAKNFRSTSWLERWAIAQNPNTPDNTLSYLVKDGNKFVRSAAELNIKQRKLANQSTDLDNSVHWTVKENPNTSVNVSDKLVCDSEKFELELQNLLSEQKEKNYKPM